MRENPAGHTAGLRAQERGEGPTRVSSSAFSSFHGFGLAASRSHEHIYTRVFAALGCWQECWHRLPLPCLVAVHPQLSSVANKGNSSQLSEGCQYWICMPPALRPLRSASAHKDIQVDVLLLIVLFSSLVCCHSGFMPFLMPTQSKQKNRGLVGRHRISFSLSSRIWFCFEFTHSILVEIKISLKARRDKPISVKFDPELNSWSTFSPSTLHNSFHQTQRGANKSGKKTFSSGNQKHESLAMNVKTRSYTSRAKRLRFLRGLDWCGPLMFVQVGREKLNTTAARGDVWELFILLLVRVGLVV